MHNRLKTIRKELKMTQVAFSESIGISRSHLSNIEIGKLQITDRLLKTICSVHNVNENWFKTGEGNMFLKLDETDEFYTLVGKLYAEDDSFKCDVIKSMLNLTDDENWKLIANLIKQLEKGKED